MEMKRSESLLELAVKDMRRPGKGWNAEKMIQQRQRILDEFLGGDCEAYEALLVHMRG